MKAERLKTQDTPLQKWPRFLWAQAKRVVSLTIKYIAPALRCTYEPRRLFFLKLRAQVKLKDGVKRGNDVIYHSLT